MLEDYIVDNHLNTSSKEVKIMKLVVSGSRSVKSKEWVYKSISDVHTKTPIGRIVCGGAKKVDIFAVIWAMDHNVPYTVYLPNYKLYGKIAPLVRNEKLATVSDKCLIIWDGRSRGAIHLEECCRRLDKEVILINVNGITRQQTDKEPQETTERHLEIRSVEEGS